MTILELIGFFTVIAIGLGSLVFLVAQIHYQFESRRDAKLYEYRLRHRFDGGPVSKCYCIDCKYCYGSPTESGSGVYCSLFKNGMIIQDNSWCYRAEPK